jgi:hypothetical protein
MAANVSQMLSEKQAKIQNELTKEQIEDNKNAEQTRRIKDAFAGFAPGKKTNCITTKEYPGQIRTVCD